MISVIGKWGRLLITLSNEHALVGTQNVYIRYLTLITYCSCKHIGDCGRMFDHFKNGADGNENEEEGDLTSSEENDYSDELIGILSPHPVDTTTYSHQDCGAPLVRILRHCGGCGQKIDWDGLP